MNGFHNGIPTEDSRSQKLDGVLAPGTGKFHPDDKFGSEAKATAKRTKRPASARK